MIQIKRPEECCGCTACAEKCPKRCISMQPDAEGFLYPVVDASLCIECGLCEKVCPVLHRYGAPEPASVRAYACCNRDEPVRMASSSGGVFSLLAGEVLDKGGVVFGARFDHDFSVVHDSVEEIAGLGTLRGSKYTQSRIEGSFRRAESLLKAGREVLFVGTSCQIAGLKRFLGARMRICWRSMCCATAFPRRKCTHSISLSKPGASMRKHNLRPNPTGLRTWNFGTRRSAAGDVIASCRNMSVRTEASHSNCDWRYPSPMRCSCAVFCITSTFGRLVTNVRRAGWRPGAI